MTNLIGHSLGRYHILEQLGEGGMATVYKAYDTRLERDVAIKIIRKTAFSAEILEKVLARFEREAKALARLSHPNIVKVLDYGDDDGSPYLVLEYLPGGTLKEALGKPIQWQSAIQLLLPVARGLAYAHQRGIIHRDVKPSNILITESGEAMLSDFGIAKLLEKEEGRTLTASGVGIGTPEYMAPEQGVGHGIDARVDIYSLGIVLYEMLTGRKPYTADTPMAVVLMQLTDPLPRPTEFNRDIPATVEKMLLKALAKKPEDRYESMDAFIKAMETCLVGIPVGSIDISFNNHAGQVDGEKTIDLVTGPAIISAGSSKVKIWWVLAVGIIVILIIAGFFLGRPLLAAPAQTPTPIPTQEKSTATSKPEATLPAVLSPTLTPIKTKVAVTLWHAYAPGSPEESAFRKLLIRALKDLPQYELKVQQVAFSDIYNQYRTDVAAGGGPDLYIAPNDSIGDDARAGLIADITDLLKGKLDGVSQLGIDGMTVDGKIYGVPESMKALAFWYDKTRLPAAPKTTDELLKLMQNGTSIAFNYGCYHYYGFYAAFGGNIFDPNWNFVADQGKGVIDAMAWLNRLYQVSKKNKWPTADSEGDGKVAFAEGKVVGITNGNWAMGDYKNALGDKLAVAPLPAGPAGPAKPMLGIDGFYINPNSADMQAAVEVALYLTNAASQTIMMEGGHVPVRTDVKITDPLIQGLVDAFNTGATIRPQVPQLAKYWANFCNSNDVFENGVSPLDWVRAATNAANH